MTLTNSNRLITGLGKVESNLDHQLAYGILRFTLGINILLHGLGPLTHLDSFAGDLVHMFAKSPLLPQGVRLFALAVPFAQTAIGLLLALGLWTRFALVTGGSVMAALVLGTALRNDGQALGIQMLYATIYYLLLAGRTHNRFSIDHLRRKASVLNRTKTKLKERRPAGATSALENRAKPGRSLARPC